MRYKRFGKSGLCVSELSVGTYGVGNAAWGLVEEKEYIKAIEKMIDLGANHLDTAINYGQGASETIIGKFIREYRDKVYVTSKGCFRLDESGKQIRDAGYENMIRSCDISLKRLGIDYLDFYLVHQPDPTHPIEETMRALNDLKKAGKTRFIGVSNYTLDMLKEAQKYADIAVVQNQYSMISRANKELFEYCRDNDIAVMTHGSLGAGILTGKIRELPNYGPNDARSFAYDYFVEPKFSQIMKLVSVMDEVSANHKGCPLSQIAINWLTQKDYVSTALVGVTYERHSEENCAGMDWVLSEEEMKKLDEAITAYGL